MTKQAMRRGWPMVALALAVLVGVTLLMTRDASAVAIAGSGNAEFVGTVPCVRLAVSTTAANVDLTPGRYQVTASVASAVLLGTVDPQAAASCTSACGVEIPADVPMELGVEKDTKLRAVATGAGRLNICRIVSGRAP